MGLNNIFVSLHLPKGNSSEDAFLGIFRNFQNSYSVDYLKQMPHPTGFLIRFSYILELAGTCSLVIPTKTFTKVSLIPSP